MSESEEFLNLDTKDKNATESLLSTLAPIYTEIEAAQIRKVAMNPNPPIMEYYDPTNNDLVI